MSDPIWNEIGKRLDEFYESSGIQKDMPPSSMLRGALATLKWALASKNNEDTSEQIVQVAHSIREIFYRMKNIGDLFAQYGSTYDKDKRVNDIGEFRGFFTEIAHHQFKSAGERELVGGCKDKPIEITPECFEIAVRRFQGIIFSVLKRQLDVHHEIDKLLPEGPEKANLNQVKELINLNQDALRYFFYKADGRWLDWLWEEGVLDIIKGEKRNESDVYPSEVFYLMRIAETCPSSAVKIVGIILQIKVSPMMNNLRAIDYLFGIVSKLPTDELAKLIGKIRDERWVYLRGEASNFYAHQYQEMFERLLKEEDHDNLLKLAEAILVLRDGDSFIRPTPSVYINPFWVESVSFMGIFAYLANTRDEYVEKRMELATTVMDRVIAWNSKGVEDGFFDTDLFTLETQRFINLDHPKNVHGLVAVIMELARHLIECNSVSPKEATDIYGKYIDTLPENNKVSYVLNLFILSLRPIIFREELKRAFFRLFEVTADSMDIIGGAEYRTALEKSFHVLCDQDKRYYVSKVMNKYLIHHENQNYRESALYIGSTILSMIKAELTEEERKQARDMGFDVNVQYKPNPSIVMGRIMKIESQAPIPEEVFGRYSVTEISNKLRNKWSPQELVKRNIRGTDKPINASGLGNLLEKNMPRRLQKYINSAGSFFERGVLDQHYTYSYLRAISQTIENHNDIAKDANWQEIILLLTNIKVSDKRSPFEKRDESTVSPDDYWLADWNDVFSQMVSVLQAMLILIEKNKLLPFFGQYRNQILDIIEYLLSYSDPTAKDEKEYEEYLRRDLHAIAINSVCGTAFELLAAFMSQDCENTDGVEISTDVKEIYKNTLAKEKSLALRFMFGLYLSYFYQRDKDWLLNLLPQIFPQNPGSEDLYIAAWEGYLTNRLDCSLFHEPNMRELYKDGIMLDNNAYPRNRAYFKHPKKGIVEHLALAFIYCKRGGKGPLFKLFWDKGLQESHEYLLEYLGQKFVLRRRDDNDGKISKEERNIRRRLMRFWRYLLKNQTDPELFKKFGCWANLNMDFFEPKWLASQMKATLEKTGGELTWTHGLEKSLPRLATANPTDTIKIMDPFLLKKIRSRVGLLYTEEWKQALRILYHIPETKSRAHALINKLIEEGLWGFKDIVNDRNPL